MGGRCVEGGLGKLLSRDEGVIVGFFRVLVVGDFGEGGRWWVLWSRGGLWWSREILWEWW